MASPAIVGQLADAVLAELNAPTRSWNAVYGQLATRAWDPIVSLDATSGLPQLGGAASLAVIADAVPERTRLTRPNATTGTPAVRKEKYKLFFLLRQKVADVTPAVIDPLAALLEEMTDYFFGDAHFVANLGFSAKCMDSAIEAYCVGEDLEQLRVFTGCSSLVFEVIRQ